MKCGKVEKYLDSYPEELPPGIRVIVEEHLRECENCRETLEYINRYREYIESADEYPVPENFGDRVVAEAEKKYSEEGKGWGIWGYALSFGTIAAVILIILLAGPFNSDNVDFIEANFAMKLEKKGKGPADMIDFKNIDEKVKSLIAESNGTIEEEIKNSVTGYYDFLTVSIPRPNFYAFAERFNQASAIPVEIPGGAYAAGEAVHIRISFDMINFTTGNFDGDGKDDLIIQFMSGRNKGKWLIYLNDGGSYFDNREWIYVENGERYLADYRLLSGDFNFDGYDDILLYLLGAGGAVNYHLLLNEHDFVFTESEKSIFNFDFNYVGEFRELLAGDADADGQDDLILVSTDSNKTHYFYALNKEIKLGKIEYTAEKESFDYLLAGDFNGDGYVDICFKFISGSRSADTDIYLNTGSNSFEKPYMAAKSFQGDYIIWSGDADGDRYADIFVKSGGYFIPGTWYIQKNDMKGRFTGYPTFEVNFPGIPAKGEERR